MLMKSSFLGLGLVAMATAACSEGSPTRPSAVASPMPADAVSLNARPDSASAARPGGLTIVGLVLQDDGEFDVLQHAVIRAGLVDALNGDDQLTVFAPTDQAFVTTLQVASEAAAISAVDGLPVDALTDILLYHVTNGRRTSQSVIKAPRYQMLNGDTLTRGELTAAGLSDTDISASNGIVHVINRVLMPQ